LSRHFRGAGLICEVPAVVMENIGAGLIFKMEEQYGFKIYWVIAYTDFLKEFFDGWSRPESRGRREDENFILARISLGYGTTF
jgi:hypothetical protein